MAAKSRHPFVALPPAAEEWRDTFLVEYLSVTNSVRGDGSKATACAAGCNLTNAHSVIWVSAATVHLGCVAGSESRSLLPTVPGQRKRLAPSTVVAWPQRGLPRIPSR